MKRSSSKSMASWASVPFFGSLGPNRYSARQPRRVTCHGRPKSSMTFCTPAVQRSARGIMRSKASLVRTFVSVAWVAAGSRENDADAGQRRLSQHAGDVAVSERLFARRHISEFNDARGHGRIDRRADVAAPRSGGSVAMKGEEDFIHRAVITPVEDQDFRAARNLAR